MTVTTVSFHNFKSRNLKLSVSNPKNKYVAYLSVLSRISNCQGLGRKNKHEILKTDCITITATVHITSINSPIIITRIKYNYCYHYHNNTNNTTTITTSNEDKHDDDDDDADDDFSYFLFIWESHMRFSRPTSAT